MRLALLSTTALPWLLMTVPKDSWWPVFKGWDDVD
jgi:hypothetical protein